MNTKLSCRFLHLFFLFAFYSVYGQSDKCKIFQILLHDSLVERRFYINDSLNVEIRIFDEGSILGTCSFVINNKNIIIIKNYSTTKKSDSDIIIKKFVKRGGVYYIELFQKDTQAYAYISVKRKKDDYIISKRQFYNF